MKKALFFAILVMAFGGSTFGILRAIALDNVVAISSTPARSNFSKLIPQLSNADTAPQADTTEPESGLEQKVLDFFNR